MQKQKQKIIFIILLIIIYITPSIEPALADLSYSKNIRANIIDKFKKEQYKNIFQKDNLMLNSDVNFFDTQSKINVFETIREKNTQKKDELELQKNIISDRVLNLEETISSLDKDIESTSQEILAISRKIVSTNQDIEKSKEDINRINKEIYENKKVLLEYITHIYKKQNLISWSDEVDSIKTILLNTDDLSKIISDIHFSSILESAWQLLVEKHRRLVKDLFVKKLDLEKKYNELKKEKEQELLFKKEQQEKREFRQRILDFTKWKQELFEQFIQEKVENDRKLKIKILQNKIKLIKQKSELLSKYNCKYIDSNTINNSPDTIEFDENSFSWKSDGDNCITLNRILSAEAQLRPMQTDINPLLWPVNPKNWISAYYKDPSYTDFVWASHEAIDIRVPQGTEIKAPADWYVTFVKDPVDEWYAYVVLKHTNWFVTVYWHISEVMLKQYDVVKAWDVFAKSWWEFWTNWAGLMTTWPHLHFELFKDKESVDPLDYLDITKVPFDKIPNLNKYLTKYNSDYELKYWLQYWWNVDILDMLRWAEWFRENAYQDSAWVWTIGYWFTSIDWRPVQEWDFMLRDEAEKELEKKVTYYTNFKNFIKVPLSKEQETALTSFEYNLWRNIWTKPTQDWWAMPIIDMINVWDLLWAAEYLKEYTYSWGKNLRWLANRRFKEANLLLKWMEMDTTDLDEINKEKKANEEEM